MKRTGTGNRPRLQAIDPTSPKYWLMRVAVDLPRRCALALPATLTFGPDEVRARLLELVAPDEANPPEDVFTPDWWRQVASSQGDRMQWIAQERFRDVTIAVRVTPENEVVFELSERRKRLTAGIAHAAARIGSALQRWNPRSIAFRGALRRCLANRLDEQRRSADDNEPYYEIVPGPSSRQARPSESGAEVARLFTRACSENADWLDLQIANAKSVQVRDGHATDVHVLPVVFVDAMRYLIAASGMNALTPGWLDVQLPGRTLSLEVAYVPESAPVVRIRGFRNSE